MAKNIDRFRPREFTLLLEAYRRYLVSPAPSAKLHRAMASAIGGMKLYRRTQAGYRVLQSSNQRTSAD